MSEPPLSAPTLELHGVSKQFGDTCALDQVDLDVGVGQTTALVGESGSGKSTVLRLLIGLIQADQGQVRLFGQPLTPERHNRTRRRIGYVIQEGGLFPHLSAADNAALAAQALGWDIDRRQARLAELATLTRLDPALLVRRPGALSGGQRQRVALMRALFLDPDLLLLDEPLGALDPIIRRELQDELKGLFEQLDKTVVMVTHDLPEAAFFSQDLVLMHQAQVVQRGSLAEFRDHPRDDYTRRFVAATRGLPA